MTYEVILDALGDPTRRRIFDRLRQGPRSVTALSASLPVSRPAVSQHLKVLKEAGLVQDQADGARRVYRVERSALSMLQDWLNSFGDHGLDAYQAEIQRQLDERRHT